MDLEFEQRSEQSIPCEKEDPSQKYHLNSPPRLDEVVQHFKTGSTYKCHNSQGESDKANVTDSRDKGIDTSSKESEWCDICKKIELTEMQRFERNLYRYVI